MPKISEYDNNGVGKENLPGSMVITMPSFRLKK